MKPLWPVEIPYRHGVDERGAAGRPMWRRAAVIALLVAAALLCAFAWGLGLVAEEARVYALVHGHPANTAQDDPARSPTLVLAGCLLIAAACAQWLRPTGDRHVRR